MSKQTSFIHPGSKLSDLIISYPEMLTVIQHLEIRFGFEDRTIREIASRYHLDQQAFIAILQVFEGSIRQDTVLSKDSITDLLRFLKASHRYFKNEEIPELKKLIVSFTGSIPEKQGKIILSFFEGYIQEVEEHFHYEDDIVFPYIDNIISNKDVNAFRIDEFEKNHTDIEQKLLDLKHILIKYLPEEVVSDYRIKILRGLVQLEHDLKYHSFIEDHLLVPTVKAMEKTAN